MDNPAFVVIDLDREHANQIGVLEELADLVPRQGGEVLAYAPAGKVSTFEPGSVASGLLIARWRKRADAHRASREQLLPMLKNQYPMDTPPHVLLVEGLPDEGLPETPEIPTTASVPKPAAGLRNMLLVVRGSVWDASRLDAYRNIILPMHKERGGYYEVFAVHADQVEAISGKWTEQILAISRWPTRAAAEDFWFCSRYQQDAIPVRLGAARFSVHALESVE